MAVIPGEAMAGTVTAHGHAVDSWWAGNDRAGQQTAPITAAPHQQGLIIQTIARHIAHTARPQAPLAVHLSCAYAGDLRAVQYSRATQTENK